MSDKTVRTMPFNPYTGKPRHPADIASDPEGKLMVDPDMPLLAASDDRRDAERYRFAQAELCIGSFDKYSQFDEWTPEMIDAAIAAAGNHKVEGE